MADASITGKSTVTATGRAAPAAPSGRLDDLVQDYIAHTQALLRSPDARIKSWAAGSKSGGQDSIVETVRGLKDLASIFGEGGAGLGGARPPRTTRVLHRRRRWW